MGAGAVVEIDTVRSIFGIVRGWGRTIGQIPPFQHLLPDYCVVTR
jgi:hypothetical protein